jgi:hypothetical protein
LVLFGRVGFEDDRLAAAFFDGLRRLSGPGFVAVVIYENVGTRRPKPMAMVAQALLPVTSAFCLVRDE